MLLYVQSYSANNLIGFLENVKCACDDDFDFLCFSIPIMARFTRRLVIFASSLFSVSVATDPASQAEPISLSPLSPVQQRNVLHERASDGSYLIATAIYTNAQNDSALQCWEFATPFTESSSAGAAGAETLTFFDLANMTYTHIPPRFAGGVHNAPMPQ